MKGYFKRLKTNFAPGDLVFVIGFTLLTIAAFFSEGATSRWCATTFIGYGFIAWKYGFVRRQR